MNCEQRVKKIEAMLDAQEEARENIRQHCRYLGLFLTLSVINLVFFAMTIQNFGAPIGGAGGYVALAVFPVAFAAIQMLIASLFLKKEDLAE